jgi:predicted unusual protein kinase regulating ubiquinone biosynthesis (AarF/ABC1/UbiB family)
MVYSLSLLHNRPIVQDGIKYDKYYARLHTYFEDFTRMNIKDLKGIELLKGMMYIVRDYGMKLNGQLGALITNLLILEQIVRDLDPNMNILTCAVPYFYAPQP